MTRKQIAQIKRKCKRLGITHQAIAKKADVTRPMVSMVLLKRAVSRKVLDAAFDLIAEKNDGHKAA